MMQQNVIEDINEVLALESRSVLEYVIHSAWPSVIEAGDEEGVDVFQRSRKAEEACILKLADEFRRAGGRLDLAGSWRFAPSRLNFATWSHLLEVVPDLIREEIEVLREIRTGIAADPKFAKLLDALLRVKEQGLVWMKEAAIANREARAKSETKDVGAAPAKAGKAAKVGELPWRSADLPLADRLAAAQSRPIADRLWAAMAQTDCTACGYDCEGYARAIASGEEKDLTKCVPGESDTADALKKLLSV